MGTLKDFIELHPNIDVGEIRACYSSCQGKLANDAFEAYQHVQHCLWCNNWLEEQKEIHKRTTLSAQDRERMIKKIDKRMRYMLG
jgi:hypothetical protein